MAQKTKSSGKSKKAANPVSPKKQAVIKPKTAKAVGADQKASPKLTPVAEKPKAKTISNGVGEDHEAPLPVVRAPRDAKTLAFFDRQKRRLLDLRDHFLDQMQSVAQDSLRARAENNEASAVGQHQADAGSDAYEKDFALSLLSQEQDALYEIEEALKRIETGTYGICEMSSKNIPHARLEAIPFARFTVECQQQLEKENRGRRRWDTAPQFMDSAEAFADEEEESSEDDDKKKEKD
jgi:RNA polymerase-binding transcription factor DksA